MVTCFRRLIPVRGRVFPQQPNLLPAAVFLCRLRCGAVVSDRLDGPRRREPSGQVLLRTFYRSNQSDGQPLPGSEIRFGWLIVSSQGLWKEYGHFAMKETDNAEGKGRQELFDRYMNEFEASFDWANPPASVQPLLNTYKFSKAQSVDPRLGRGGVKWTPKGIYSKKKLLERDASQMTIGKKPSVRGTGSEIEAAFFTRGVALFRNESKPETEKRGAARGAKGAVFSLASAATGGKNIGIREAGIDVWEVDGICLLKTQQKPQQKKQQKKQPTKAR